MARVLDFVHLAITICRCLSITARNGTGYLGGIGIPDRRQCSPLTNAMVDWCSRNYSAQFSMFYPRLS
jgi:hypothetical protein